MTYKETIDFLYSQLPVFHRIGKAAYKANLDNTIALDDYFGNPHKKFRSVHIAGTNGKGSVSHMLASVLQEAGYRTGLYTSPHLKDYRERIRINGLMIPEAEVVSFVDDNLEIIESIKPSFFELSVAMAFKWFEREKVDAAVIETGLGGRLDSTNIITPVLSVITNIGLDHTDLLGDTLQKIAVEKAGIIKEGIPVIIGESTPETADVFSQKAASVNSPIVFADELYECLLSDDDPRSGERKFVLNDKLSKNVLKGIISLAGDYQSRNLPVVAAAVLQLRKDFSLSDRHLIEGVRKVVANTGLMGRWQILSLKPLTICDTGHNSHGLKQVLSQLSRISSDVKRMVIGFVNDKDIDSVLPLFPKDACYYFTRASVPRAMDENVLQERAGEFGLKGKAFHDVASALASARSESDENDLIFIGGSTFVVAEVL